MSEEPCTAVTQDGEERPNVLFTPPCECPKCAAGRVYERAEDDGWLRMSGDPQRYRVEMVELGATGRAILG